MKNIVKFNIDVSLYFVIIRVYNVLNTSIC